MSDDTDTNDLHLPSLSIRGFRGIICLDIERLGRVTLLAGKNGVGKTTVLDAMRLLARRCDDVSYRDVLVSHDEIEIWVDEEGARTERPAFEALFHGRRIAPHDKFSIGAIGDRAPLTVEVVTGADLPPEWLERLERRRSALDGPILRVSFETFTDYQPVFSEDFAAPHVVAMRRWRRVRGVGDENWPDDTPCVSLGPDVADNRQLAEYWDEVALTPGEDLALSALQLACRTKIEGVAPIERPRRAAGRRMMVKPVLEDRVPLRSLGDGAVRMLGMALGLVSARDGFLLIDEAENGIHHTLQREYWATVLRVAREYNVQVLATTHSWDCVAGFAHAAFDDKESEGIAIRLEVGDDDGSLRAVEYTERMLKVAAEQGIEVR